MIFGFEPGRMQFVSRESTRWILVERAPGEAVANGLSDLLDASPTAVSRVAAGTTAPRTGWWFSPVKENSRRYFKRGDTFPEIEGNAYGATF
ncbi:hypothetical protein [Lysobacter olei]